MIGFAGLGLMGLPMARRVLQAGHPLAVWNRSKEKAAPIVAEGAILAVKPADLAAQCEIVLMCLTDTAAVEEVVFGANGLASGLGADKLVVDFSSIRPDLTREISKRLTAACGARWIDAPVSGGVPGAEKGTLAIMAGGEAADIERARPVIMAMASRLTHMGPSGAGQTAKLCNQVISGCTMALVAEAVRLGQAAGIDARLLPEALKGGFADSTVFQLFTPRMVDRVFSPPLGKSYTMLKDLDTATDVGRAAGASMPMTTLAAELFRQLGARGGAELDPAALIALFDPGPLES